MKKLILILIIIIFCVPALVWAGTSPINFTNTCVASDHPDEIIIHNIEYNTPDSGTVKLWAKFKFNLSTLQMDYLDSGLENTNADIKEITLDTSNSREYGVLDFSNGAYTYTEDWTNFDMALEPWCMDGIAFCANYVDIGVKPLADITSADIPATGLDNEAGSNCETLDDSHSYIVKNQDGSIIAFKIKSYEKLGDWTNDCDHKATIEYKLLK